LNIANNRNPTPLMFVAKNNFFIEKLLNGADRYVLLIMPNGI